MGERGGQGRADCRASRALRGFCLYTVNVPRSVSCFNMITDCCSLGTDRGQRTSAII